jgi:hypothetical protein
MAKCEVQGNGQLSVASGAHAVSALAVLLKLNDNRLTLQRDASQQRRLAGPSTAEFSTYTVQPGQGIVPEDHQHLLAALNDAAEEGAGAVVHIRTEW